MFILSYQDPNIDQEAETDLDPDTDLDLDQDLGKEPKLLNAMFILS